MEAKEIRVRNIDLEKLGTLLKLLSDVDFGEKFEMHIQHNPELPVTKITYSPYEEINGAKIQKEKELRSNAISAMDIAESEKKLIRFFVEKNKTGDVIKISPTEDCITLHGEDDVNSFIETIQKVQKGPGNGEE